MVGNDLERKIMRIEQSYDVTIPLEMLKENGIDPGDSIVVEGKGGEISLRKSRRMELPKGISPDFFNVLEQEHDEAFKGLVDR